jgi:hypothetical protein
MLEDVRARRRRRGIRGRRSLGIRGRGRRRDELDVRGSRRRRRVIDARTPGCRDPRRSDRRDYPAGPSASSDSHPFQRTSVCRLRRDTICRDPSIGRFPALIVLLCGVLVPILLACGMTAQNCSDGRSRGWGRPVSVDASTFTVPATVTVRYASLPGNQCNHLRRRLPPAAWNHLPAMNFVAADGAGDVDGRSAERRAAHAGAPLERDLPGGGDALGARTDDAGPEISSRSTS